MTEGPATGAAGRCGCGTDHSGPLLLLYLPATCLETRLEFTTYMPVPFSYSLFILL